MKNNIKMKKPYHLVEVIRDTGLSDNRFFLIKYSYNEEKRGGKVLVRQSGMEESGINDLFLITDNEIIAEVGDTSQDE